MFDAAIDFPCINILKTAAVVSKTILNFNPIIPMANRSVLAYKYTQ
jgi:hypothetical protein